jgi:hypothetical protein
MNDLIQRANMGVAGAAEETREIAEIQAKMILARNFPRDVDYCRAMIAAECQNKELAEMACYEFPRGDSVVRGASIRLVECVSRHWGNIVCGVKEIGANANGTKATVKSFAWDLQTNFADEKVFDVEFVRTTKKGTYPITDPRDKYEFLANQAARRKRACIQAVIPKFIIDEAVEICSATLEQNINKDGDIETTKAKMLAAFKAIAEWIGEDELSGVCGKAWDSINTKDIVKIRNLYNAIKDGFVRPEVAFGKEEAKKASPVSDAEKDKLSVLNEELGHGINAK